MQYYANPTEMVDAANERQAQLLREAEIYRRVKAMQPASTPLSTRIGALVQGMAQAGRQHWLRTRTIFKLAPAE